MKYMEEWKDLKGFEGIYQISNLGNVKSLSRIISYKDGRDRPTKEKLMKLYIDSSGYYMCNLRKDKKTFYKRIHILVYETFVGEIPENMVIDHINRDKLDNRMDNLRCVQQSINSMNSNLHLHYKPDIQKVKNKNGEKTYFMLRFTMYGKRKTIGYYSSYEEAENKYKELFSARESEYKINGIYK